MKVCFAGYGSIAQRHISNLNDLYSENCIIDVLRQKKVDRTAGLEHVRKVYYNWDELDREYDVFFITNPTSLHYDTLKKAKGFSKNIFVEKPVFDKWDYSIESLDLDKNGVYYVACPLRYTSIIEWLRENVNFEEIYSFRVISSSFLPEWRNTDYRKTYSAQKELGGGVSKDLVHEWDYLSFLIGFPDSVKSIISHKSKLEINSDDIAVYIADYSDKIVEVHLDYFGRTPIRKLELYSKEDTIIADFIRQKISFLKADNVINLEESRNDYQKKELRHFLDIVHGVVRNDSDIYHAIKVLKIATGEWG